MACAPFPAQAQLLDGEMRRAETKAHLCSSAQEISGRPPRSKLYVPKHAAKLKRRGISLRRPLETPLPLFPAPVLTFSVLPKTCSLGHRRRARRGSRLIFKLLPFAFSLLSESLLAEEQRSLSSPKESRLQGILCPTRNSNESGVLKGSWPKWESEGSSSGPRALMGNGVNERTKRRGNTRSKPGPFSHKGSPSVNRSTLFETRSTLPRSQTVILARRQILAVGVAARDFALEQAFQFSPSADAAALLPELSLTQSFGHSRATRRRRKRKRAAPCFCSRTLQADWRSSAKGMERPKRKVSPLFDFLATRRA